ncbi:(2Fe-2S)-binding protein [Prolixibacteraceae bacterium JC049]|nr:(2Fe-2S)-binding protein [Prolixibacteraceae bacterium JC049]
MSLSYKMILWNKQKKVYDIILFVLMMLYIVLFSSVTFVINPNTTIETLIIRAFGTLAILMLHIILAIGPLSRLNSKFLVLLYNRRHLGVSMFLAAFIHGAFSLIQFHSLGNTNVFYSLFTSNLDYFSLIDFPFQVLGFFALMILLVMAVTSHDFWLHNLSPKMWKTLHMMVYLAYALVMLHVFLGAFQQESSPFIQEVLLVGFIFISALHIAAAIKEKKRDINSLSNDGWHYACNVDQIPEKRAFVISIKDERVAIFKYDGKLSTISNVCKHQNGPLGEGKIVDGCVTCPWHGYQYLPAEGKAPAPFTETLPTYNLKLEGVKIFVHEHPNAEGEYVEPLKWG